jgi:oligopeptide transport system ATP-binding protein
MEQENKEKKVIVSIRDLEVKFNVRGRQLTAIRGVDLDIYDGESIAIVGESGSGKSVLTKTISGMTDSNGFISKGDIILRDDEISDTKVRMNWYRKLIYKYAKKRLDKNACLEQGGEIYAELEALEKQKRELYRLPYDVRHRYHEEIRALSNQAVEKQNLIQLYDRKTEKDKIHVAKQEYSELSKKLEAKKKEYAAAKDEKKKQGAADTEFNARYAKKKEELLSKLREEYKKPVDPKRYELNDRIAKEVVLSVSRYGFFDNFFMTAKLVRVLINGMKSGKKLEDEDTLNRLFDQVNFRVKYEKTLDDGTLEGYANINLAKVHKSKDWQRIRGTRIATVFQDPMTSLNPIIKIGEQISSVIMKHQHVSHYEAKKRAIEIMKEVGINDPEKRYDDYPFEYSGGMRQRIVIAIALSCAPKILICDEPTTALDVTIQAQIIRLIKSLQKKYGYTCIYITHDLGVVANVAQRVVVLYAGQPVEIGTVEDIFYRPLHPYTWALLSALPQLSVRGEKLYAISGTPPSLYTKVKGDAFALRSDYTLAIDLVKEPPMFKVSETHYAKTWLLDPRAPKVEKPKNIQNLHEKMSASSNVYKD